MLEHEASDQKLDVHRARHSHRREMSEVLQANVEAKVRFFYILFLLFHL